MSPAAFISTTSTGNPPVALLTLADAAKYLSVGQRTLARLTAEGKLPCVRIGRAVRYHVPDLDAFINQRKGA
jgi:excisionase family DNA binding protein